MTLGRAHCQAENDAGAPCQAPPVHGGQLCFWHTPELAAEADEARRLGGLRRRRDKVVLGTHDLHSLRTVDDVQRVMEVAVIDALGLENSIQKSRTLIAGALAVLRTFEFGDLAETVKALEALYALNAERNTSKSAHETRPLGPHARRGVR